MATYAIHPCPGTPPNDYSLIIMPIKMTKEAFSMASNIRVEMFKYEPAVMMSVEMLML